MAWWGAAASLAGGALSAQGGQSARRRQRKYIQQSADIFDSAFANQQRHFEDAKPFLFGSLKTSQRGERQALGAVSDAGRFATQGIMANREAQLAATQAQLMQGGLGNATVLANAKRGVYADTSRGLGQLGEGLGQLRSSIIQNGSGRTAQLQQMVANAIMQQAGAENSILQNKAGLFGNIQVSNNASAAGAGLGTMAGFLDEYFDQVDSGGGTDSSDDEE